MARSTFSLVRQLLLAAIPLVVGGYLGWSYRHASQLGGFNAAFAIVALFILGFFIVVALLVGGANLLRGEGRGRGAARVAFATAVLLAVGGAVGYALA